MSTYYYKAVDHVGANHFGEMEAASREVVVADLLARGLTPVFAGNFPPTRSLRDQLNEFFRIRSFGLRELAQVTSELSGLLQAGFSLDEALGAAGDLSKRAEVGSQLQLLREKVRGGDSFSNALLSQPRIFPRWYINLIRAGEASGDMSGALERLGRMLGRSERIKEKVRSALIYPIVLLVMIAVVMGVVLTFVIPAFEPFFEDMGTQLPLSTRIVLGLGGFVATYAWALIIGFILCGVGLSVLLKKPSVALRKDHWMFTTRLLLGMPQKREVGEFCRTLGEMLGQGEPLQEAFDCAGDVVRNLAFKAAVVEISLAVREGSRIGPELERSELFPDIAVRLVKLGEESGNLSQVLGRIGVLFEMQVELAIDRLLAILVPGLTIIMGLLVAGFIGSILVGLMSVTNF
jgi:general secretion pathway protein F